MTHNTEPLQHFCAYAPSRRISGGDFPYFLQEGQEYVWCRITLPNSAVMHGFITGDNHETLGEKQENVAATSGPAPLEIGPKYLIRKRDLLFLKAAIDDASFGVKNKYE